MYIGHCQLLSGPPDIAGCAVDDPEENSCHGIRCLDKDLADCFYCLCQRRRVRAGGPCYGDNSISKGSLKNRFVGIVPIDWGFLLLLV